MVVELAHRWRSASRPGVGVSVLATFRLLRQRRLLHGLSPLVRIPQLVLPVFIPVPGANELARVGSRMGLRGDASAEKESFARRSGHTGRERGSIFRLAFAYAYPFSGRAARAPFVGLSNGRGSRGWRGASSRGARSRSMVKRCDGRGSLRGHGRPSGGSGGWRSAQLPAARRVRSPTLRRPARCTRACAPALPSRV